MPVASSPAGRAGVAPRIVNTVLGAWLIASIFVWPHYGPEGFDTLITGLLVVTAAPLAVWAPRLRFGPAFFAVWLVVMTLVLVHERRFTFFHDLAVAIAIILVSAVPSRPWVHPSEEARA